MKTVILNANNNTIHILRDKDLYNQVDMKLQSINKESTIIGRDQNNQLIIAEKAEIEDV